MNMRVKYTLILGATVMLSFCNAGRQSSVYDPNQGAYGMSAQQRLSTNMDATRELPANDLRSQRYVFNIPSKDQLQGCLQTYSETQTASYYCTQVFQYMMYGTFGSGYSSGYVQNPLEITGCSTCGNNPVSLDWQGLFKDQGSVPQFNQYMQTNYPYFQPQMNMQNFCTNPQSVTNIQYSNGCGKLNANYVTINLNNNMGMNYMRQGDMQNAYPYFGPGGYLQTSAPQIYSTVLSRRDIGAENAQLQKDMEASWTNLKGYPKKIGLTAVSQVADVGASFLERILGRFTASTSRIAMGNYVSAGQSAQQTAYNNMIANHYYTASRASQYTTLSAVQADNPCPVDRYHYEINTDAQDAKNSYIIKCK